MLPAGLMALTYNRYDKTLQTYIFGSQGLSGTGVGDFITLPFCQQKSSNFSDVK